MDLDKYNLKEQYEEDDNSNNKLEIPISSKINFPIIQLFKYSQVIQDYFINDSFSLMLTEKIQQICNPEKFNESSIITFLELINDKNVEICNEQFYDLCKLSEIFKVKPLEIILQKYSQNHSKDFDFIIKLMIENESEKNEIISINKYSAQMEKILSENLNKCLENENFEKLQISTIYRIIKKSEILEKNLNEKLSDEKLNEILEKTQKEDEESNYYQYLPINFKYIKTLRDENLQLKIKIKELERINEQIEKSHTNIQKENTMIAEKNLQLQVMNQELEELNKKNLTQKEKVMIENQKNKSELKECIKAIEKLQIVNKELCEINKKQIIQIENYQILKL